MIVLSYKTGEDVLFLLNTEQNFQAINWTSLAIKTVKDRSGSTPKLIMPSLYNFLSASNKFLRIVFFNEREVNWQFKVSAWCIFKMLTIQ